MQITSTTPDGFTPVVVKQTKDYLYAEYTSPLFGVSRDLLQPVAGAACMHAAHVFSQ